MSTSPAPAGGARPTVAITLRRIANLVNLSTPAGWALARSRGVPLRRGPHGLLVAYEYPKVFPAPRNSAITIGDVVLVRSSEAVLAAKRPKLLDHEARHAAQWACCLGPALFLPLYGIASLWSLLRTGHPALANVFEVAANLSDGGYRKAIRPVERSRPPGPPRSE